MTSAYRLPEHPTPQPFRGPLTECPYCGRELHADTWWPKDSGFGRDPDTRFAACSVVKRYRYGIVRWWRKCQHEEAHVHQWCMGCGSEWIVWPARPIAPESLPGRPPPLPDPPPPHEVLR